MILSGFIATNSWQGAVLQIVEAVIVGVIWFPFLMIMDRKLCASEAEVAVKDTEPKTEKPKTEQSKK